MWHQTGTVHQDAGEAEAAEDAYRKSLAIKVRLGNIAGQANTLGQLGLLYGTLLDRPEEAVAFIRQAADKFVEIHDVAGERRQRSNLANNLRKLGRFEEARKETYRAIECHEQVGFDHAGEPWKTWAILAAIENDAENPAAAKEANLKAIHSYLAYRRDGGENHDPPGRICLAVSERLLAGDPTAAATLLDELVSDRDAAWLVPFIQALQAIVAGSRDRSLGDAPGIDYKMSAEILWLLQTLEQVGK
jgi:tetratricopeptide (TPR) repeat protein